MERIRRHKLFVISTKEPNNNIDEDKDYASLKNNEQTGSAKENEEKETNREKLEHIRLWKEK